MNKPVEVEIAEEAIAVIFRDRTVPSSETKEKLEGLKDYIDIMIDTLED